MNPRRDHEALAWDVDVWVLATAAAIYAPLALVFGLGATTPVRLAELVVTLVFATDAVLRWLRVAGATDAVDARTRPWRFVPGFGRALDVLAAVPFSSLPVPPAFILARLLKLWRVGQLMRAIRSRFIQRLGVVRLVFFVSLACCRHAVPPPSIPPSPSARSRWPSSVRSGQGGALRASGAAGWLA